MRNIGPSHMAFMRRDSRRRSHPYRIVSAAKSDVWN